MVVAGLGVGMFLVFGGAALPAVAAAGRGDPLVVTLGAGVLRGRAGNGVREFKGIPYAAPPLGALRWTLPQPAIRWRGVRDAAAYRSACPQPSRYGLTDASDDEDCLFLNVTTPAAPAVQPRGRPVLVWIHGGAFIGGSSNLYPLDYLAREGDLVVVSMNYRLGVFGFMPHPSFEASHNGGYALEDQRAALRWVKRNIAAFGGDPSNVTIAGESAGAASVCMHLIAPDQSRGLFEKAIVQSAACAVRLHTVSEAEAVGRNVAHLVGCDDAAGALACLRTKTVAELLEAAANAASGELMAFAPAVGSRTLPQQGAVALATGEFLRVPLINGGNRDEMRLYVGYDVLAGKAVTPTNYLDKLRAIYGESAAAVAAEYPIASYSSAPAALGTVLSDFMPGGGLCNCLYLRSGRQASVYAPVFEYEFADRAAPPVMPDPGFELGAVHAAELPYQFPHISHTYKVDGPDLGAPAGRLAAEMLAYWSHFAHSGAPAPAGLPAWPDYSGDAAVLRFDAGEIRLFDAGVAHHCEFWQRLYPEILGR